MNDDVILHHQGVFMAFFALIELMGQRRAVGRCRWMDGGALEVEPVLLDGSLGDVQTFGPCALYRVYPCSEEVARLTAKAKGGSFLPSVPDWAVTVPPSAPRPVLRVGHHLVVQQPPDGLPGSVHVYASVLHLGDPVVLLILNKGAGPMNSGCAWQLDPGEVDAGILQIRDASHRILWTKPGATTLYDNDPDPTVPF